MTKVIVVGSGAGGAVLTRELAINGFETTLIEKGPFTPPGESYQQYQNLDTDIKILKTECLGGTTMVTAGNAVRTCQNELKKYKVDIGRELDEVEKDLQVNTLPDYLMGEGTHKIMEASHQLGFSMNKMPKFINPRLCRPCGKCTLGCPRNAKWTSMNYVEEALDQGAHLIENQEVTEIIHQGGIVKGLKCGKKEYLADVVVLAAGAIETPRILQKSGINAGSNLFTDTFITVGGFLKDIEFYEEVTMYSLITGEGFILSPHYSSLLSSPLEKFGATEKDIMGIMVKIKDENCGIVKKNSAIKYNTSKDVGLLAEGASQAGAILTEAGVDPKTLVSTPARGAHPGGTAAVGRVVDHNLETEIKKLFVADASVLPDAPGAPPILTILALSKRLARHLTDKYQ